MFEYKHNWKIVSQKDGLLREVTLLCSKCKKTKIFTFWNPFYYKTLIKTKTNEKSKDNKEES